MSRQFLINLARRSAGKTAVALARPSLKTVFMPPAPTLPVARGAVVQPPTQRTEQNITGQEKRSGRLGEATVSKKVEPLKQHNLRESAPVRAQYNLRSLARPPFRWGVQKLSVTPVDNNTHQQQNHIVRPTVISEFPASFGQKKTKERPQAEPDKQRSFLLQQSQPKQAIKEKHRSKMDEAVTHQLISKETFSGREDKAVLKPNPVSEHVKTTIEKKVIYREIDQSPNTHSVTLVKSASENPDGIDIELPKSTVLPEKVFSPARPMNQVENGEKNSTVISVELQRDKTQNNVSKEPLQPKVPEMASTTEVRPATNVENRENIIQPDSPALVEVARVAAPVLAQESPRLQPLPRQNNASQSVQVSIGIIDLQVTQLEQPRQKTPSRRRRSQGFTGFQRRRTYSGWEE